MVVVAGVFLWRHPARRLPELPVLATVGSFQLTNQFGLRVGDRDLEGLVLVADVIFSRCPGQCHKLSQLFQEVQRRLPPGIPARLVSLTADPDFDTPEVLLKYSQRYGADGARWVFMTGPKRDVYALAVKGLLFSVVENPEAAGKNLEEQFIHSASFAVVDRRGRLRAMVQLEDPAAVEKILKMVKQLAEEHW